MPKPDEIAAELIQLGASDLRHLKQLEANRKRRCELLTEAHGTLSESGTVTPTVIEPKDG